VGTFWKSFKEQFNKIFNRMTPVQRSMVITVSILSLVVLIGVMVWAGRTDYSTLYSGLDPKDAGRIAEKLRELKVEYKLENGGSTVMVSSRKVQELRIEFASLGLPRSGELGYEVFDKTNIGMTDFVQKLNYHRALEGELARTIIQIEGIEQARVHIVIPEPALFQEDKKETTASVVLRLSPHITLSKRQVQGIAYLVAYSIEGLSINNVNIIDSSGNILTDSQDPSQVVQATSRQLELQRDVEKYLRDKAQSMLDGILGVGKSQIRVAVTMNFDQVEKTMESYDPEKTVVRSEQRTEVTSEGTQTGQPGSTEENNVTNYEIDKTVEHLVESVGEISRISASVLVDGVYKATTNEKGEASKEYQERPASELKMISEVVKNAIGFDASRQDQISVQCFRFDNSKMDEELAAMKAVEKKEFWTSVIQKVLLGVLAILAFLFLRSIVKRSQKIARELLPAVPPTTRPSLPGVTATYPQLAQTGQQVDVVIPELEEALPVETVKRTEIQRRVKAYVKEKPREATQLIRSWMIEEQHGSKE
jgi:flagellar M-ring protein FliF